jgi:cell division transport system permease protein
MSRLAYFVRETLISLRRNLLMTLAGIITVAVSLALFGGIRLVQTVVDHGTSKWKDGVELEIFMEVDAGEKQIEDVRSQLEADDDVRNFKFLTKEDAYNEFKRIFRDQPALIESRSRRSSTSRGGSTTCSPRWPSSCSRHRSS